MIAEWKKRLIRSLGGVVPGEKSTVIVQAEVERTEELRVDRLGPSEDDLEGERESFANRDPWRPSSTLGPIKKC